MSTEHAAPARPSASLPLGLKLLIIELAGIAMIMGGLRELYMGNVLGLPLVLVGADLLLRPGARRRPPRPDRLVLEWQRRRHPPPPR